MRRILFWWGLAGAASLWLGHWRQEQDRAHRDCGAVRKCDSVGRNPGTVADSRWEFRAPQRRSPGPVWRESCRNQTRVFLRQMLPWPGLRALSEATWLGDATGLPRALLDLYREGGLLHILALSGQHLGSLWLLAQALLWGMAWGFSLRGGGQRAFWVLKRAIPLALGALFLVINPGNSSLLRAFGMWAAYQVCLMRGIAVSAWQLAASCTAFFLVADPELLARDSFLLSSWATLVLGRWLLGGTRRGWRLYVELSMVMPVLLLPMSAFFFGKVSVFSSLTGLFMGAVWSLVWIPLGFVAPLLAAAGACELLAGCEVLWQGFIRWQVPVAPWIHAGYWSVPRPTWWEFAVWQVFAFCVLFKFR